MFKLRSFLMALSLIATAPCFGKDLSLEELKKAQDKVKAFENLTVDFEQSRVDIRKKTQKSVGKAMFSKPDKFRWQLVKPHADEWIYDGKQLLNYKPEEKEATRYAATGNNAKGINQIVDVVMNMDALLKRYDVIKSTQEGSVVAVELKPKSEGDIKGMNLRLDVKAGYVSFLKLFYRDGNDSELTFNNPKKQPIPASTFVLPKGVKITDTN